MSATYRIDIEHKPANDVAKWIAHVYRLSDDLYVQTLGEESEERVVAKARAWIAQQNTATDPYSIHTDDTGRNAPSPVVESIEAYNVRA